MRADAAHPGVVQDFADLPSRIFAKPREPRIRIPYRRAHLDALKSRRGQLLDRARKILRDHLPHRPRLTPNRRAQWIGAKLQPPSGNKAGRCRVLRRFLNELSSRHHDPSLKTFSSSRYSSHPLRRSGRTYFCAASALTFMFARSQLNFCPQRVATFPSSKVSVTIPENSKFPPGFTLLPLHASSHSRSLPGDRGSVFAGCL